MPRSKIRRRKSNNAQWLLLGVGAALIIFGVTALIITGRPTTSLAETQSGREPAPDFSLPTLDDTMISLSDYEGQWVLVNLWATWCPPCRAELPDLVRYADAHADDNFVLLGINEQEPAAVAANYVAAEDLDFIVLLDSTGTVMNDYGVTGLPSSYLINPAGEIVRSWTGMINQATLEQYVTPLLNEQS